MPHHQLGIDRRATNVAAIGPKVRPQSRKIDEPVDLAKQVIVGDMPFEAEAVKQRLLHHPPFGHSFALTAVIVLAVQSMSPADVLTIGTLLQTSRLFGGEIGTAFMQTFVRVREQVHSNLIGLHVDSLGGQTADRLAAYRSAVGAHSSDAALAAERATSLLGSAVAKQAAVLSYIDGFFAAAIGHLCVPVFHRHIEAALRIAGGSAARTRRGAHRIVRSRARFNFHSRDNLLSLGSKSGTPLQ